MKENILIITIGTRDVQTTYELIQKAIEANILQVESRWVDKNTNKEFISGIRITDTNQVVNLRANTNEQFRDFYIFPSPRQDVITLAQLSANTLGWLAFPLIANPLDWLQKKIESINYVLTVFTDQNKEDAGYHWKDDTLYFNKLIQNFLRSHTVTADAFYEEYPIKAEPVNIDYQYDHFEQAKGGLLNRTTDDIENIYLLAQGGIDQINTALTLKLIEHFPGKVRYLQQPEDQSVEERKFPRKFLNNLNKAKSIELLNRFDFHAIQRLCMINVRSC